MTLKNHVTETKTTIESGQFLNTCSMLVAGIKNQATSVASKLSSGVILFMWLSHIARTCVQSQYKGLQMVCEVSKIMYNDFCKGNNAKTIESKTRYVSGCQPSDSARKFDMMTTVSHRVIPVSNPISLKFHKNLSGGVS